MGKIQQVDSSASCGINWDPASVILSGWLDKSPGSKKASVVPSTLVEIARRLALAGHFPSPHAQTLSYGHTSEAGRFIKQKLKM